MIITEEIRPCNSSYATNSYDYEIKFLRQNKDANLSMKQQNNTFGFKRQKAAKQTFELLNCSGRGHTKGPSDDTPTPPSNLPLIAATPGLVRAAFFS